MISKLLSIVKAQFSTPELPFILFCNETGVSVWDQRQGVSKSEPSVSIDSLRKDSTSASIDEALGWIAERTPSQSAYVYLVLGGKYSWTDLQSLTGGAHESANISQERGADSTICEIAQLPQRNSSSDSEYHRWYLDRRMVTEIINICADYSLQVVALDSLGRFIINAFSSDNKFADGMTVTLPYESVKLSYSASGETVLVSETHNSGSASSPLIDREAEPLDLKRLIKAAGSQGFTSPLSSGGEISRDVKLKIVSKNHDRYSLTRWSSRIARFAAALSIALLLSGIGFSYFETRENELGRHLTSLRTERDQLRQLVSAQVKANAESYPIPGLSAATSLGRLGQKRIEGVQLTSVYIQRSESKRGSVSVNGLAENEAQIFGYVETLREWFPGYDVRIESIANQSQRRTRNQDTRKQFTIEISV